MSIYRMEHILYSRFVAPTFGIILHSLGSVITIRLKLRLDAYKWKLFRTSYGVLFNLGYH